MSPHHALRFALVVSVLLITFGAALKPARALEYLADATPDGKPHILVTGEFMQNEDLDRFERLVATTGAENVTFNSPGGSVYTAMELGRTIRRLDLGTIAVRQLECASACALAFLGGTMRYAQPGSIGVHRSSFTAEVQGSAADQVAAMQQVTADVIQFLAEMGADPALLGVALSYDSTDIRYLSGSEMMRYRVTTPEEIATSESGPSAGVVPTPMPRPDEQKVAGPTSVPLTTAPGAPAPSRSDQLADAQARFGKQCKSDCGSVRGEEFCARYCVCVLHELMLSGGLYQVVYVDGSFPGGQSLQKITDQCTRQTDAKLSGH
jgi:hypothetical protein